MGNPLAELLRDVLTPGQTFASARDVGLPLGPRFLRNIDRASSQLVDRFPRVGGSWEWGSFASPHGVSDIPGTSRSQHMIDPSTVVPAPGRSKVMPARTASLDDLANDLKARWDESDRGQYFMHSHPLKEPDVAGYQRVYPLSIQDLWSTTVNGWKGIGSVAPTGGTGHMVLTDNKDKLEKFRRMFADPSGINGMVAESVRASRTHPGVEPPTMGQNEDGYGMHKLREELGISLGGAEALRREGLFDHYSFTPGNQSELNSIQAHAKPIASAADAQHEKLKRLLAMLAAVGAISPLATQEEEVPSAA